MQTPPPDSDETDDSEGEEAGGARHAPAAEAVGAVGNSPSDDNRAAGVAAASLLTPEVRVFAPRGEGRGVSGLGEAVCGVGGGGVRCLAFTARCSRAPLARKDDELLTHAVIPVLCLLYYCCIAGVRPCCAPA